MKKFLISLLTLLMPFILIATPVEIKYDNGTSRTNYDNHIDREESLFLMPDGPCNITELKVYFAGTVAQEDTIYIVGDPSEGTVSPTFWVLSYNIKYPPIVVQYDGKPGWRSFPINGLRSDGLDRICVQHRVKDGGPYFGQDTKGQSVVRGFYCDTDENNSLGGPGAYKLAVGNFMIRLMVEYDLPFQNTSQLPPAAVLTNASIRLGITDSKANLIASSDVSIVDWNNDNYDDIAIGSYFFENHKDGTFINVSAKFNISAGMTSWADFDGDGFPDCYALVNGAWQEDKKMMVSGDAIYKNNSGQSFSKQISTNLFKTPYPNPSDDFKLTKKYINDTIFNPYSCITPLWGDFNGDGRPDLFLANNRVGVTVNGNYCERYFPDQLWLQNSSGQFENNSFTSGILGFEKYSTDNGSGWFGWEDCYGASASDYNKDGKTDIFVATYRLVRDRLYRNDGAGKFTDVGTQTGVLGNPTADPNAFGHGMGSEWADINNDGLPDLTVGNLGHPDWRGQWSNPSLIFINGGASKNFAFTENHRNMGLKFFEMNAGVCWADLDLDGNQDLWHGQISYNAEGSQGEPKRAGHFYMNQGAPDFKLKDMTWYFGALVHGPWSAARIDYDRDGDIDLVVCSNFEGVKVFRNDMPHRGKWIELKLKGSPKDNVSTECFGCKATIYSGNQMFYRDLNGSIAGTRTTQNSFDLHFGLGNILNIDSIVINYPNGQKNLIKNIEMNNYYVIPYMQSASAPILCTPALQDPPNYCMNKTINKLVWNSVAGAVKYEIQYSFCYNFTGVIQDTCFDFHTVTVFGKGTTELSTTFTDQYSYNWRVRAFTANDSSNWSTVWSFTNGKPKPSAPTLVSPANKTTEVPVTPQLVWLAAYYPISAKINTAYNVQISKSNTFSSLIVDSTNILALTANIGTILEPQTTYYWRCRAINADVQVQGDWSNIFSFTTLNLPLKVNLSSPANNDSNIVVPISVKWQSVTNSNSYIAELATDANFSNIVYTKNTIPFTKLTLTANELKPNTKYFWHVRGTNDGGNGSWSDTWSFKTGIFGSVGNNRIEGVYYFQDVHPNPSDGNFSINLYLYKPSNISYKIYNESGELIFEKAEILHSTGSVQLVWDSSLFSTGVYYIKIYIDNYQINEILTKI
ncbi:MAG: FG-GAP-like repeat-containing protein [Candidatus Kapabacteria bacterium]|nr:FG-GAP-like repeat-containing protein [Candidatus Kapabacteria bacterium]